MISLSACDQPPLATPLDESNAASVSVDEPRETAKGPPVDARPSTSDESPTTRKARSTQEDPSENQAVDTTAAAPATGTDAVPEASESSFPDERSTGVPAGVALRDSGPITVDEDGAVIDGLDVRGPIHVKARNVTIRNTRVTSSGSFAITYFDDESERQGLVVENSELDGNGSTDPAIIGDNYTIRQVHIHDFGDGPRIGGDNVVIEDSYIADLTTDNDAHNDGVQMTEGSNVTIRGNHIHNPNTQTSAIFIGPDLGPISNVTIERNLLRGGGYTVYAWGTNVKIVNNRIEPGFYGPRSTGDSVTWTDNVDHATGRAVE